MSLIKGIRNYKSKIIIVFMLLSGFFMVKRSMDESKKERSQYFYNFSGELMGELSFDGDIYALDTDFMTYEFTSNNCGNALSEFTKNDKIVKQKRTNRFVVVKSDGRKMECR